MKFPALLQRQALHAFLLAGMALAAPAALAAAPTSDAAYPGQIGLAVDLRDTNHRIFTVHETVPVSPGPLTLLYPQWIPGEHGPTGPIDGLAGVTLSADGQVLPWRRDLVEMYALHVEVPPGARTLDIAFQYLSPGPGQNFGAGASTTPVLAVLEWNQVVLYPAGYAARQIPVHVWAQLPAGWGWGTALESTGTSEKGIEFAPVSLETLVDSPLITGQYFRRVMLSTDPVPVALDIAADRAEDLVTTPAQIKQHENLVREAAALFGAHHYAHYDFLFTLSDFTAHFGLEHHQSSDNRTKAEFFLDPDTYLTSGGLLPHEYVHSWNGKFRRPAGLLTPAFSTPMKGDLLWVYEGLTTYWGNVLTARTGLFTPEQYREHLARTAAGMDHTTGRAWRALQDTADAAQILYGAPGAWRNYRRSVDYYPEGELIWLDADTLIQELSHGQKSLDDFAHLFHGRDDGQVEPRAYTFDDVVAALDRVQHYDWAHFLRARLDGKGPGAPLDGLARGGWKLVYTDEPNSVGKAAEKAWKFIDHSDGIGLVLEAGEGGTRIVDVTWKSAAFDAGIAPGVQLVAVNGIKASAEGLAAAIKAAEKDPAPVELLLQDGERYRTVKVDYHDGLRYPHLVRVEGAEDRVAAIGRAHAK